MRPQELYYLFSDVSRLKGVGPALRKALSRLLSTRFGFIHPELSAGPLIRDLAFHLPSGVVDRRYSPPIFEAKEGEVATFMVTVDTHLPPQTRGRQRFSKGPYKIQCSNASGSLLVIYFNTGGDYLIKAMPVGQQRVISGRIEKYDGMVQMPHPDIIAPLADLEKVKRLDPIYPLTAGIGIRQLSRLIHTALAEVEDLPEWIDPHLLAEKGWKSWKDALLDLHRPKDLEALAPLYPARLRLAYDEILANQLALALVRARQHKRSGQAIEAKDDLRDAVRAVLPFLLTAGQENVLKEIDEDMASGSRMTRLLQGDVGSGKTAVALMAMLRVVANGKQAAFMAPTEIVTAQHREFIARYAEQAGVRVALLTGSVKGAARKDTLAGIASGEIDIVIGTHALFQGEVVFKNLALAVIDEQHRFGVAQRLLLTEKGDAPHILLMTATPIPRSLTMTAFGDMDCSLLTEKPAGRKPITTRAIPIARYDEVVEGVKRAMESGNKVYWICPMIEEAETVEGEQAIDLAAAEERFREFHHRFGDRVGMVHGRMKMDERERVMAGFAGGAQDILVATTVVEVGVDVPAATIMVIEHAERFGLAQLHQLRGRVGRGDKPSSCILLYGEQCSEVGRARLRIIRETEDGFRIAEEDMRLRGSGDILGTRQSGMPEFHFADLGLHTDLIHIAREDAKYILHQDNTLSSARGKALRTLLYLFSYDENVRYLASG